jgi:hypothetical protein
VRKKRWIFHLRWFEGFWASEYKLGAHWYRCQGYRTKAEAERFARRLARIRWERDGEPAQLIIHRKDGAIASGGRSEASYGCNSRARG